MKPIADLALQAELAPERTEQSQNSERRRWRACMHRLWSVMADRYGSSWTAARGEVWDEVMWAADLEMLTPEAFGRAVKADLERGSDFPPSSSRFALLARENRAQAHVPLKHDRALERPKPKSASANAWAAYQQRYGLARYGLSEEQIEAALAGQSIQGMHATVRAHRQEAGLVDWATLAYVNNIEES